MLHRLRCCTAYFGLRWDFTIIEVFAIVAPSRARNRALALRHHVRWLAAATQKYVISFGEATPVSGPLSRSMRFS
jgi:hypothetical protein